MKSLFVLIALALCASAQATPELVVNVTGYTLDSQGKLLHFSQLAFDRGKVLAIGDDNLLSKYPQAKQIDGKGRVMLPGLIDAHGHLLGLGANLLQVDLRGIPSAQQAAEKVQAYAKQNPTMPWLTGRGWNQVLWADKKFPNAALLDKLIADRPVWLERVDGHAGWANSNALQLAGIDRDTPDPPGGKIVRNQRGDPTGILIDNAMPLLTQHLPKADKAFYRASLQAAGEHLLSQGITAMHDAGINADMYEFYQHEAKAQRLPLRIYAMLSATDPRLTEMLKAGHVEDKRGYLSIRSVKAYGDGALGSRGAALLAPYSDAPHNSGLLLTAEQDLKPLFDLVIGYNFQLNVHAIGDKANRLALNQFAETFSRIGGKELRHRIEHAQVIDISDIPRFNALGIVASMQPTHATSDMNMAQDRVGKQRLKGAYAWQTLHQQGARLAFGSDFPVELANPFFGLHAAVTRQDRHNQPEQGWRAEESVSIEQAFRAFTLDAAYAAHQEAQLGGLTPGKWADFILVDQDIFRVPAVRLWRTQVLATWIAGQQVFSR